MKQRRTETQASRFDPTDYAHLDNADLSDFVTEFLSRNQAFRKDYERLLTLPYLQRRNAEADLLRKWKVYVNVETHLRFQNSGKTAREYMKSQRRLPGIVTRAAVRAFRITDEKEEVTRLLGIRKKAAEAEDFVTVGKTNVCRELTMQNVDRLLWSFFGEPDEKGRYVSGDTLLLSINLDMRWEEIESQVRELVKLHRQPHKAKIRPEKWKHYLIVYDLKKASKRITYEELADELQKAYPKHARLFDEENLKNYYGIATDLIDKCGYKKHI